MRGAHDTQWSWSIRLARRSMALGGCLATTAVAAYGTPAGHPPGGCHVHGLLPDRRCTPGAVFTSAGLSRICVTGYSRTVRHVTEETRREVYLDYGIAHHVTGAYEVDHLIPLEIGGSNSVSNLWPEAYPHDKRKDRVENALRRQVCDHTVDLRTAQQQIATDWVAEAHTLHITP